MHYILYLEGIFVSVFCFFVPLYPYIFFKNCELLTRFVVLYLALDLIITSYIRNNYKKMTFQKQITVRITKKKKINPIWKYKQIKNIIHQFQLYEINEVVVSQLNPFSASAKACA